MISRYLILPALLAWAFALTAVPRLAATGQAAPAPAPQAPPARTAPGGRVDTTTARATRPTGRVAEQVFKLSNDCMACHNQLTTATGEDVSIGVSWRASMMANSGRDPYWMGSVRREILDHPQHQADIEDECTVCHMPMARTMAVAAGRKGQAFAHLAHIGTGKAPGDADAALAADGVSCTLCHQIGSEKLGTPASYVGGYVINPPAGGVRAMQGPYDTLKPGHITIMQSVTGVQPAAATHLRGSELCATCHTLITEALDEQGRVVGRLPEQMPYQEWQHSDFRTVKTCQQCHMPAVETPTPITSVFGEPRDNMGRHTFLGGNFFMLRLLNRHRRDLNVQALPQELEASARATIRQLQADTATLTIARAERAGDQLQVDVQVANLTGHKLPTGYPARRTWLHLVVRDSGGRALFESGAPLPTGAIAGNDNDDDASRFEPHRDVIRAASEVQIYESVMGDVNGVPTTGLLRGVRFLKDNRLLPRGFDKATAADEIAVRGEAVQDANFTGAGDRVRYEVPTGSVNGPLEVTAELLYQPIAYRWAANLSQYNAPEPQRFASYYQGAASGSAVVLARGVTRIN